MKYDTIDQSENRYKYIRCMSEDNYRTFNEDLKQVDWNDIYDVNNVNQAYDKFIFFLRQLYERHFPLKKVKHCQIKTMAHKEFIEVL